MKPFNLQEALAGKPVVTRDGRPATHLVSFPQAETYTVVAAIDSWLNTFTNTGKYINNEEEHGQDLFMASTKKTGWVNIYRENLQQNFGPVLAFPRPHVIHPSKAVADEKQETTKERIAVVELTWEE
jgi:hypothetical protein